MDNFLLGLKREELLAILENELSRLLKVCADEDAFEQAELSFSGLSHSEVIKLLKGKIPMPTIVQEETIVHKFPCIVINTQTMKISASVEETVNALMKDNRAELVGALLGEGALND